MNGRNGPKTKNKKQKTPKTRNIILFVPSVELEYHLLQIFYFRLASWIFEECYKQFLQAPGRIFKDLNLRGYPQAEMRPFPLDFIGRWGPLVEDKCYICWLEAADLTGHSTSRKVSKKKRNYHVLRTSHALLHLSLNVLCSRSVAEAKRH